VFPHPGFKPAYRELVERLLAEHNPIYEMLDLDLQLDT
jgi:hypothetical protein